MQVFGMVLCCKGMHAKAWYQAGQCNFTLQGGMLCLPWMILSGYEIGCNLCVAAAFLLHPGPLYCTVAIAIARWGGGVGVSCRYCRALVLRWIWARAVRKQMLCLIEQASK